MTKDDLLTRGAFTLPGEAGYEELTLRLARKWGADTIRDSDGTQLSPEITDAGYDIYSTVCLPRSVNGWAKQNMDKLQQNFLMSFPVMAQSDTVTINLLEGYFDQQFAVNADADPKRWWQVFDRTTGEEVEPEGRSQGTEVSAQQQESDIRHPTSDIPNPEQAPSWDFNSGTGTVTIHNAIPYHRYTVNFLAWRLWEEISMYNHITNDWGDREHLMAVDPIYPETLDHLLSWFEQWLKEHSATNVVRFTSMFYNFTWFWGDDLKHTRDVYSDWADYAMTVSPRSLELFEKARGYSLCSEDFVNGGLYNCTHNAPSERYRDYMDFMHDVVVDMSRKFVDLTHQYGKKAFVFYDDSWVGVEPYGPHFADIGFDGLIKCVFNAFEARKCAGCTGVETHELRLHPYLFPTGLKGEPTFAEGGDPTRNAKEFWIDTRRAMLRARIDRIGLGGYLSLTEPFPEFCDYIEGLSKEFRLLKSFHERGKSYTAPFKVAVLTAWGSLRSWIASGHFVHGLEYNELLESLAGLPLDVEFINFDDLLENGVSDDVQVIINCGCEGSAWSGGRYWDNPKVIETLQAWVAEGGSFIGIAEPSALRRPDTFFQLSPVLGVDRDTGARIAHGKYKWDLVDAHFITEDLAHAPDFGKHVDGIFTLGADTKVLATRDGEVMVSAHTFGKGRAVYLSGFRITAENTRLIHRAIHWAAGQEESFRHWTCSNVQTECAYFAAEKKLVVINNSDTEQTTDVFDGEGNPRSVTVAAFGIHVEDL